MRHVKKWYARSSTSFTRKRPCPDNPQPSVRSGKLLWTHGYYPMATCDGEAWGARACVCTRACVSTDVGSASLKGRHCKPCFMMPLGGWSPFQGPAPRFCPLQKSSCYNYKLIKAEEIKATLDRLMIQWVPEISPFYVLTTLSFLFHFFSPLLCQLKSLSYLFSAPLNARGIWSPNSCEELSVEKGHIQRISEKSTSLLASE